MRAAAAIDTWRAQAQAEAQAQAALQAAQHQVGRLPEDLLVGLPPGEFSVPLFGIVADCITIRGSFVGNRRDMAEALAFGAEGRVKADIELQPLTAINDVFARLARGAVPSRVVLDFSA